MSDILGLAGSAMGGGIFGLIGTGIGRVAGYFENKQANKHETARWAHDIQLLELQTAAQREQTEADIALSESKGSWAGLTASMQAEASIGDSYLWVNAVRGLTRPFLTLLLWIITLMIFLYTAPENRENIINTATFAATAATLWWFGDRGPNRAPKIAGPTQRLLDAGVKPIGGTPNA